MYLPNPSFFHGQEGFRKVKDTEGRVFEPLEECGHDWMLWETFLGI